MVFNSAISYLEDNFHCKVVLKERLWIKKLPIYLSKGYEFLEVEILDSIFILVDCSKKNNLSSDTYQKHILSIEEIINRDNKVNFILVFNSITNYLRMRLINSELSFIAIGKQIYIPRLGSVFVERRESKFANNRERSSEKMLPSTQALFLELLITQDFSKSMEKMARRLDMTKMSISRAYVELKNFGLIEYDTNIKLSKFRFSSSNKETWEKAQDYLINPVLKKVSVKSVAIEETVKDRLLIAGESALAQYTMLADPEIVEYGITSKQYALISKEIEEIPIKENDSSTIFVFKHRMPCQSKWLHPLAIALMFKEEIDERIQGEIENMMKTYNWTSEQT